MTWLKGASIDWGKVDREAWPWTLPVMTQLETISFDAPVTFLCGDNGTGKSTLMEALAVGCGCSSEGGPSGRYLTGPRWHPLKARFDGSPIGGAFFLRAEAFFNLATRIENAPENNDFDGAVLAAAYDGRSPHAMSHGQAFLGLFAGRMGAESLWLMDEPEAPLAFQSQLALLRALNTLASRGSQFVIATHSPVLLALPGAAIYELDDSGIRSSAWEDLDVVQQTRGFLDGPERYFRHLFDEG